MVQQQNQDDANNGVTPGSSDGTSAKLVPSKDSPAEDKSIEPKKWQQMVEKVKKAEERDAKILETLGVKPKAGEEIDVVTAMAQRIKDMESLAQKSTFEASVAAVHSEKYKDAWQKITEDKKHLIQSGDLSYVDLWKMIRDEGEYQSSKKDAQETKRTEEIQNASSVPFFNGGVAGAGQDNLSDMDKEIARKMGWNDKTFERAGVK